MARSLDSVHRRRRLSVFGGTGAFLAAVAYLPLTLLAPIAPTAPTVAVPAAPASVSADLAWPSSTAIGVGVVGQDGLLASAGESGALPMASITKVVTALVVLDELPLQPDETGPVVTMGAKDVDNYWKLQAQNAAVKPVHAGLQLTQYQLLQATLMSSAANYTHSLMDLAFDSVDEFVETSETWLVAHGLHSITVVEPTGLDPRNTGTVADLVRLGTLALSNPVVAEIVATPVVDIPGVGELENSNDVLGTLGIDGIKTGTLPEAGACLLFSSDFTVGSETLTIVGVALGGEKHEIQFPQIRQLVASVQEGYRDVTVLEAGDVVATYETIWGDTANAVASESVSLPVWSDTPVELEVTAEPLLIASDGAVAGSARVTVGDAKREVPLVISGAIGDPGPLWRLGNPVALLD